MKRMEVRKRCAGKIKGSRDRARENARASSWRRKMGREERSFPGHFKVDRPARALGWSPGRIFRNIDLIPPGEAFASWLSLVRYGIVAVIARNFTCDGVVRECRSIADAAFAFAAYVLPILFSPRMATRPTRRRQGGHKRPARFRGSRGSLRITRRALINDAMANGASSVVSLCLFLSLARCPLVFLCSFQSQWDLLCLSDDWWACRH